nr:unnamed protein product [Callosobruchus chinensis]
MLKITEEDVNTVQVSEINCHDFNVEKLTYDSAVLELESPLQEGKWKPVKIAKDFTPSEGQKGTIIGWVRIFGDSGTALIVDGVQVGIASFITNICGTSNKRYPNVYSRVSSYYDWIHSVAIDL